MERGTKYHLGDDTGWADRAEFWNSYRPTRPGRRKKYRFREPLIISGHGANIRIDQNTLLVRNGFTHYPQKSEEIRFFPGDRNLPDRIIILDASGGISFDALTWMSDQKIPLVQLNWRGEVNNCISQIAFSAAPKLVEAQWRTKNGPNRDKIARWLIAEKIVQSIETLKNAIPESEIRTNAITRHERRLSEIRNTKTEISISHLLGIEGDCAQSYFMSWVGLPIKWFGTKKKPIPDNWLEIVPRTIGWKKRAYVARHPINAMLNYGYGILINDIRTQIIAAGLDPTIGIIHGNKNPMPLVYDLIESLRPIVDKAVIAFALANTFSPGDFTINSFGGCRLNPQLAKTLVARVLEIEPLNVVGDFIQRI